MAWSAQMPDRTADTGHYRQYSQGASASRP